MADPIQVSAAQDDAKAQQAALLAAIAEQGSRGAALYGQAAQQAQADRATALQSAVQRAQGQGGPGGNGAPAALTSQLSAQAVQPADARAADVAQAQTAFNQDQASLTSANDNYMNQLAAAVPVVQSRTDATVAQLQAQAAQAAQQRALQLQLGQLQLQQEQAARENTKQAGVNAADNAKRDSVAQQKRDAANAEQQRQNNVISMAQQGGSTGQAFMAIIAHNKDFGEAMADVNAGLNSPDFSQATASGKGAWGNAGANNKLMATFGSDLSVNDLQTLLAAYYGIALGGGSSGSDAPQLGRSGAQ